MKYCPSCGATVTLRIPDGDNMQRHVCDSCGAIHYQNPKIVAGCIPVWQEKILLCRRAIEPRYGLWTLPAGFMENGETTLQAAARETMEEACAELTEMELFGIFNLPHISQVYMMFRAAVLDGKMAPGVESLEVKLFTENEIPWEELAFPVVQESLQLFFSDRKQQSFPTHFADIIRGVDNSIVIKRY